jgi:gliding motility-associated-like protein
MAPYKSILLICLFLNSVLILFSQKVFYQDICNCGVTGAGFSSGSSNNSFNGQIDVHIEPESVIKKAYLICNRFGVVPPVNINFNGNNYTYDLESQIGINYDSPFSSGIHKSAVHTLDITNEISSIQTSYTINCPAQMNMGGVNKYGAFYLLVIYENATLPQTAVSVIINEQDSEPDVNYQINNLLPINISNPVGLAIHSDIIWDTITDGSYIYINGNYLGLIGGSDAVNSSWTGGGVKGHFYYQNDELFGLDDDSPDDVMGGTDGLADIVDNLNNNDTSFEIDIIKQPTAPYNIYIAFFLTYTTPCDIFQTDLVTEDTTICSGQPLQLGASGGINYNWLPQTGLSCYDCPNPEFVGDSSIVYTVRIWSTDSCSKVLPVKVKVLPQPEFSSINLTSSACGEENGTIVATASNGTAPYHYQLDGGASVGNGQFSGLASSTYTLTVTDSNGCSADSTVFIGEEILVHASFTLEPPTGSAPLWVQSTNASTNATNYLWSWANETSTDTHPGFMLDTSGTYTVTLVAYNNFPECADTFSVQVVVYDSLHVVIPNVFTPNNDHSNDFFGITTNVPTSGTVVILNRWGNVMLAHSFSTQPHLFTPLWDGKEATEGVYFYRVRMITEFSGQGAENEEFEYSGFVTLVR